jgi:uncharacterized iron-regulated protein
MLRCAKILLLLAVLGAAAVPRSAPTQPLPPIAPSTATLGRDHPLAGQIIRIADGAVIDPATLAQVAATGDFVLLGEKHDHPDHHRLQAWVIDALVASGRRPAIAMEMLDADQLPALNEYRKDGGADAAGLGAAIGWEARGWPDWPIYAPIAEVAFRAGLPILPADLSRTTRRGISRGGIDALEPDLLARLGSMPRFDAAQSASLAQELRASHCGHLPEEALPRMADVQRVRDAHMAAALRDAAQAHDAAVLIAGAGHVRTDRGVPWHLQTTAPRQSIVALAFVEVDDARRAVADYALAGRFDYVWFTARLDDEDPCAIFRDSLHRLRQP